MSKVVRISGNTYERMQKIAKPLDDTPDTVIQRLLDSYEGKKFGERKKTESSENRNVIILEAENPIDLTHSKIHEGKFGGIKVKNWFELVSVAHKVGLKELGSFNELRKMTISNIVEGDKVDSGYKPIKGADISIQGANANMSWISALKIAKRLKKPVKIEFRWRHKSSAKYPNKKGMLEWSPD